MAKPLLVIGNRNYSSWSLRAWLIVRKSEFVCDEVRIPLFVDGFEKKIREYSAAGKVPVLLEGGIVIWDSLAIAEYVAELVPRLWPRDTAARAHARSVAAEMHSGFAALRNAMPMNCRAVNRRVELTPALEHEIRRIEEIVADCRSRYAADGPWLFGTFCVADAMYAPVMSRFITYGIETNTACSAYADTVMRDPDVMEWYAAAAKETETIDIAEVGAAR